jgi:hypothetical protein
MFQSHGSVGWAFAGAAKGSDTKGAIKARKAETASLSVLHSSLSTPFPATREQQALSKRRRKAIEHPCRNNRLSKRQKRDRLVSQAASSSGSSSEFTR